MAGLLAPHHPVVGLEGFQYVAVADLHLVHLHAGRTHSQMKTQIGHYRHHDGVPRQPAPPAQVQGEQAEKPVPVDDSTRLVHRDHPVGVPIEGQAHLGAFPDHRRGQVGRVRGPAGGVDVAAVGGGSQNLDHVGSGGRENLGGRGHRGAIGTVDDDPYTRELTPFERRHHATAVPAAGVGICVHAAQLVSRKRRPRFGLETGRRSRGQTGQLRLHRLLLRIAELPPSGREQLDPVVEIRVM